MKYPIIVLSFFVIIITQACNKAPNCDLPALDTRNGCAPPESTDGLSGTELILQYVLQNNVIDVILDENTGLYYKILESGNDDNPESSDYVTVDYVGYYRNGCQFDGNNSITFGLFEVIEGWTEGLQLIGTCGTIQLFIPPSLAYGETPANGIAAGEPLIFDINLLNIE